MSPERVGTGTLESRVREEASEGTWPILRREKTWSLLSLTGVSVSASICAWAFAMGGALAWWAPAWAGSLILPGGVTLGVAICLLAVLLPSMRYGIDSGGATKPQFGALGAVFTISFICFTMFIANASVIVPLGGVIAHVGALAGWWDEGSVNTIRIVAGLLSMLAIWVFVSRGAEIIRRTSVLIAALVAVVALVILIAVLAKYGFGQIGAAEPVGTSGDRQLDFALASEFAIATGLSWWAYTGAITRMGKKSSHGVYAALIGMGIALSLTSLPSLYAGLVTGDPDPSGALTEVLGLWMGLVSVAFMLLANIGTGVVGAYAAGVAVKQLRPFRTRPSWPVLMFVVLLPSAVLVCFPEWFVTHQPSFFLLTGLFPAQFCAVQIVDFYVFRRRALDPVSLFDTSSKGKYFFWGGINPAALVAVASGSLAYWLMLLDPMSYVPQSGLFKWITASIPSAFVAALTYWALTRFVVIPLGKGGYERYHKTEAVAQTSAESKAEDVLA